MCDVMDSNHHEPQAAPFGLLRIYLVGDAWATHDNDGGAYEYRPAHAQHRYRMFSRRVQLHVYTHQPVSVTGGDVQCAALVVERVLGVTVVLVPALGDAHLQSRPLVHHLYRQRVQLVFAALK